MNRTSTRPEPVDETLAGFSELLEKHVPGPVAAIYETGQTDVESISLVQCIWSPGERAVFRYRIDGSGGDLSGRVDLVVAVGSIPAGAATVEGPDGLAGVWTLPNDPALPGLPSALDLPTVARLVSELGSDDQVSDTRLRAYRPGRRAVVEVDAGRSSIFLKVVPPANVEALHQRHRHLSGVLPIPDSLGVSRDLGIVAMQTIPGTDLRSVLRAGGPIPDPAGVTRLIANLPAPRAGWHSRSPIESVPRVVDLLSRLLPEESSRLAELAIQIGTDGVARDAPVHGDFHEAQILVRAQHPVGVIDVGTYGWGRRGDDAATMLGHLHLLAARCKSPELVIEFATALNRRWDASLDPVDLRLRIAAVVLGLATGPFRAQRPAWRVETSRRIQVAQDWVESARRVHERSLISTSGGSHSGVG